MFSGGKPYKMDIMLVSRVYFNNFTTIHSWSQNSYVRYVLSVLP